MSRCTIRIGVGMLINSLYGMVSPKQTKEHQKKLQAAIEYLGNKYLLATSIKKKEIK